MKLWRYNPNTPEGKYPIVLRRDASPLKSRFLVITLKDPCAEAAFRAYAEKARELGLEKEYVDSVFTLADEASLEAAQATQESGDERIKPADPDAPPHRTDDPVILAWARSIGCPGS